MVRTRVVVGDTVPTIILLKGKTKRAMFNDYYMIQKGLNPGYNICMKENTFTVHNTWCEATKKII